MLENLFILYLIGSIFNTLVVYTYEDSFIRTFTTVYPNIGSEKQIRTALYAICVLPIINFTILSIIIKKIIFRLLSLFKK